MITPSRDELVIRRHFPDSEHNHQQTRYHTTYCRGPRLVANHLDLATKEMLVTALSDFESTMLFVSHDRHFLSPNRVLELTPEGIHQYGGDYTEYVARTGQEAPGLRS